MSWNFQGLFALDPKKVMVTPSLTGGDDRTHAQRRAATLELPMTQTVDPVIAKRHRGARLAFGADRDSAAAQHHGDP